MAASATAVGRGLAGTIRVAVTPGVGTALHPRIAAAVTDGAPGLRLRLSEARFGEAESRMRGGELDLIVTRTGVFPGDVLHAELAPSPAEVIVASVHPLAARGHVAVEQLDGLRLQLWNPADHPYSREVLRLLAAAGARVDLRVAAVIGGGGPPLLPADRFALRAAGWPTSADQVALTIDPPGLALPLHLVWRADHVRPVVERIRARMG